MFPNVERKRHAIDWDQAGADTDPNVWLTMKRLASEKWANIPGQHIEESKGDRSKLVSRVRDTYNISELEAHRQVQELERSVQD